MSSTPTQSRSPGAPGSFDSGTSSSAPAITIRHSGGLIQKISRHEKSLVSHPPSTGPTAAMPAMVAPHMPNAAARSLPWKLAFTSDRLVGSTIAPPTPCTARAASSSPALPASAAAIDPRPNTTTPSTNSRLRPKRSAVAPTAISSAAKSSA